MRGYDREDYADFGAYWRGMMDCYRALTRSGYVPAAEGAEDVGGAGPLAQISPAESGGEGREGGGDEIQD